MCVRVRLGPRCARSRARVCTCERARSRVSIWACVRVSLPDWSALRPGYPLASQAQFKLQLPGRPGPGPGRRNCCPTEIARGRGRARVLIDVAADPHIPAQLRDGAAAASPSLLSRQESPWPPRPAAQRGPKPTSASGLVLPDGISPAIPLADHWRLQCGSPGTSAGAGS